MDWIANGKSTYGAEFKSKVEVKLCSIRGIFVERTAPGCNCTRYASRHMEYPCFKEFLGAAIIDNGINTLATALTHDPLIATEPLQA